MFDILQVYSRRPDRLVSFAVLGATFYVSLTLLSVELGSHSLLLILAYPIILLFFISLSERAIASLYKSIGEVSRLIIGNAIGIMIGTSILLLLVKSLSNQSDITPAFIISGVMTFFVLGTLCPLVHKTVQPKPTAVNVLHSDSETPTTA